MKIALNIETIGARRGGAEKYAGTVARWLIQAGNELHVFAREVDTGELPEGTPVHRVNAQCPIGFGWLRTYLFARRSEQMLREQQFDLILGFNKVWHVDAYLAVGGAHPASLDCNGCRFRSSLQRGVWWTLKWLSPKQWVFEVIARRQFDPSRVMHVIAPSRFSARHFEQYHGVPADRISVVYNALDSLATVPDEAVLREQFRRSHGLTASHVATLFVARNYELKGLEPLLRAFVPVARQVPGARLVICGSDRDRRFRRLAEHLGLQNHTRFLGFVDDVRASFAGCDLFAFPTFYDPCSLVVLEAMNAGLPVITTRQNGAGELLADGVDGYVINDAWSLDDLTDRLLALNRDSGLRRSMSVAARLNVRRYTVSAREQEMLAAIERARRKEQQVAVRAAA